MATFGADDHPVIFGPNNALGFPSRILAEFRPFAVFAWEIVFFWRLDAGSARKARENRNGDKYEDPPLLRIPGARRTRCD